MFCKLQPIVLTNEMLNSNDSLTLPQDDTVIVTVLLMKADNHNCNLKSS